MSALRLSTFGQNWKVEAIASSQVMIFPETVSFPALARALDRISNSHRWATSALDGLHLVNLPTTAYVFDKKQPCGWVDAQMRSDGITLRLNALDGQHSAHGKSVDLAWRK